MADGNLEREGITYALKELTKELRRGRRWRNLFRLLVFVTIIVSIISSSQKDQYLPGHHGPQIGLVDISGAIMPNSQSNADHIVSSLSAAFKDAKTRGVILRINSPGGSPVQASYIYNNIRRLRKQYPKTPLYAVCADTCASAAYFIASGADRIYANPSSLVGSIGVLIDSFGFVDGMKKVGVERRLFTAGKNKGFLDPFSPLSPVAKKNVLGLLAEVHQQFIHAVVLGRGKRLKRNTPDLFSGRVWTGYGAKKIGLIDGFGSTGSVARGEFKSEHIVNYTIRSGYFEKLANRIGASFVHSVKASLLDSQASLR